MSVSTGSVYAHTLTKPSRAGVVVSRSKLVELGTVTCAGTSLGHSLKKGSGICDTGDASKTLISPHRTTFAAHTSDWFRTTRDVLAWCRATIEAIAWPKRIGTRGDIRYPGAPAETFRSVSHVNVLYTAPVSRMFVLSRIDH